MQGCIVLAQVGAGGTLDAAKTDSLSPAGLPQSLKTDRGGASTGPDSGSILATRLIGQQAFSNTGEELGRVSDIAFSQNLQAEAAIITVTGTLGLRTKDVMVPVSILSLDTTGEGTPRLTVAWSREQIASAPVFDRSALMR